MHDDHSDRNSDPHGPGRHGSDEHHHRHPSHRSSQRTLTNRLRSDLRDAIRNGGVNRTTLYFACGAIPATAIVIDEVTPAKVLTMIAPVAFQAAASAISSRYLRYTVAPQILGQMKTRDTAALLQSMDKKLSDDAYHAAEPNEPHWAALKRLREAKAREYASLQPSRDAFLSGAYTTKIVAYGAVAGTLAGLIAEYIIK